MLKKRKGFTLLEAIITVVILSVSSVIILQVFYTAGNLSRRANDLDTANSILAQAIEVSKNAEDVTVIFNNDEMFDHKYADTSNNASENEPRTFYVYYDKDWNSLEKNTEEIPENTKFTVKYELIEENTYYDESILIEGFEIIDGNNQVSDVRSRGVLYTINGTVSSNEQSIFDNEADKLNSTEIAFLSGSKFIGNTKY